MKVLPLPDVPTDGIQLADWLELSALIAADKNSSRGDLERALQTASIFDPEGSGSIDAKCLEVFFELEQRAKSADSAYPFEIKEPVIRLKSEIGDYLPYFFCLCLSFFRSEHKSGVQLFPRRMFENLACVAAQNFVGGEVVRFASPRDTIPSQFGKAVDVLCRRMGEGQGFRIQPTLSRQDDTLDVVAWRHFKDGLPGKLVLFGQCASGRNWEEKASELTPEVFCTSWMIKTPVNHPLKAFFVPHRVDPDRWEFISRRAGIVFDRCRIAYWASLSREWLSQKVAMTKWCQKVLPARR